MNTETVMKDATQKMETMAADAQKAMTEQMEKMSKGFEEATSFGQETADAMMKSSEIATKALEGWNAEVSAYAKKSFDDGVAAAKDLAAAKNVNELLEKQSAYAKTAMEEMVAQMTKMNEMAMAASKDAMEPISARFTKAGDLMRAFTV
ncbi:MAG: phasin family protein [Pseudomonadota bacterium]